MSIYPLVTANPNLAEIEEAILKCWKDNKTFEKSVSSKPLSQAGKTNEFVFYDGPPFANGQPHYGHLLTGFIKDTVARYQTMKGRRVERRFGWDCHGLPAEMGAEKELKVSGRQEIINYGIDKFNAHCQTSVLNYESLWKDYVERQARWVNMSGAYKTMDNNYMESVMWAFAELYKKGYIYKAEKVMPYSWACQTPLSHFETRLDNSYRNRTDKSVTAAFKLKNKPSWLNCEANEIFIIAWTTTPWTLPSNTALAVHQDLSYSVTRKDDMCYVVGSFAAEKYAPQIGEVVQTISGKALEGLHYEPLFEYFKDLDGAFRILCADFIQEGSGTGIVHIAPGFGEEDNILASKENVPLVCPVDSAGKFTSEIPDLEGMLVFDGNDHIINKLKATKQCIKVEQYVHSYPHCWRTDTPLIYKAMPSWYVKVTAFKDRMLELNKQINWIPSHIRDGIFHNWLAGAQDWAISRQRFWGAPIPVWMSDDPSYPRIEVYSSIAELEESFGVKVENLHRPYIDHLVKPNPDDPTGKSMMRRVEDVFDCWFESGSMPFAHVHYPFENKEWFDTHHPADFIAEYIAQTRGWFYTLLVLSTALFDRIPFRNCICHGVILDTQGQKLSKRLNNYEDPMVLFGKYGADAMRMTMLSSAVTHGQEFLIDKDGKLIYETLRLQIKPIWQAYHFFTTYANLDAVQAKLSYHSSNKLDNYILAKLKLAINKIDGSLAEFNMQPATEAIQDFVEVLNNWYIRRSRARFWKSDKDEDKISAYDTLFTCLEHLVRAISPLLPLLSEAIYKGLWEWKKDKEISVHLSNFPDVSSIEFDKDLVEAMDLALEICNSALFVRSSHNIRVRQPLQTLAVIGEHANKLKGMADLIQDEVNVKEVSFSTDTDKHFRRKIKPILPQIALRIPSKVKQIIADIKQEKWHVAENGVIFAGETQLMPHEVELALEPDNQDNIKVVQYLRGGIMLDLDISKELKLEGIARDLIRLIQQARKDAGCKISSRINLGLQTDNNELKEAILVHKALIEEQTLSKLQSNLSPTYKTFAKDLDCHVLISA